MTLLSVDNTTEALENLDQCLQVLEIPSRSLTVPTKARPEYPGL